MDAQTKRAIDSLARELQRTQEELARVKRGSRRPQLGHSSIDSGALEVRDAETGATRLRLGYQPDGSVGAVAEGGDPPPAPTTPVVEPIASGLSVRWDGQLADGAALPGDFDHVNVYVSPESGFTPGGATFAGTIHRDGGALPVAPLEIGVRYYARLVGVGTGGVQGPPSQQSSGVPESVTDIEPGSITETEIADDAISTPKIRAEAVTALKIAAEQINAGHIQAAAVTAAKLEAELVLGTRIIAGTPSGARVELDSGGLRGYTAADELAFAITETGDAVFSGTITGSEITGSRMRIGSTDGIHGTVDADTEQARVVMDAASGTRAQLVAHPDFAEFGVYSDGDTAEGSPAGMFWALPGEAFSTLQSRNGDFTVPYMLSQANADRVFTEYRSGTGSEINLYSSTAITSIGIVPEESPQGAPSSTEGSLYAFRDGDDVPLVSLQSPRVHEGPGQGRRSVLYLQGTNGVGRDRADMNYYANRHWFANDSWLNSIQTEPGRVELASTHSILSARHRYVKASWLGEQPTFAITGQFVEFTPAQYERPIFQTGASGSVRVTVSAYGRNQAFATSLLIIGFAVGTYGASRSRAAEIRVSSTDTPSLQQCAAYYLDLQPDTAYILVPHWYLSSGSWGSDAVLSSVGENSIVIEALT